jgi:D-3-phosphoglycerate dehydrogenase
MKILVSDSIADNGLSVLKDANLDVLYLPDASIEEKSDAAKEINGWIIRSGTIITEKMIEDCSDLQVIGRAGVGVDNIDIQTATRHGIVVMNTPDINTISAAEHTLAMMLSLSRNIAIGDSEVKQGEWNRNELIGSELSNKVLGIVGMGKIGREVMTRCRSFGMTVLGYDPFMNQDMFNPEEVRIVELEALIFNSDIISIHVPLTNSTRDLFDYDRLSNMKSTARIINVARGGIINETDLAKALNDGLIAGAAVDVFTSEPLDKLNPLVNAPNIVLTPHLGASTKEAKEGVSLAICEQVRDYLIHGKLNNAINIPIADIAKLKELEIFLDFADTMGNLQSQLNPGVIKRVQVESSGSIEDSKPLALAFLKGLLSRRIPDRVNYINAETLAVDLGISIEHSYTNDSGSYTNLIRTKVSGESEPTRIAGSIFEGDHPRLVNILGYEMDLKPYGTMLFTRNKDVPGVIGSVGTILGNANINIGGYFLSREMNEDEAFSVIRVDSKICEEVLVELQQLPEILSIQQLHC